LQAAAEGDAVHGGDLGPAEVVAAVKLALADEAINPISLVGDQAVLEPLIAAAGLKDHARLAIVHASEVITMEDKPLRAIARKKDSSMVRGFNLVREGQAAAFVSSGNTGALMAGSKLLVGSIAGVDRPVLAAVIPRENGHFILIDAGANPEATAEHLVHNAILGADYARVIFGIEAPRVGLLTIGTEEGKGTALTTEANNLLKKINGIINYSGPIEGFQVFRDHVDVVVCDGFVGNVALKASEGLAKLIGDQLRSEFKKNLVTRLAGVIALPVLRAFKRKLDPRRYNGASLLGLNGVIIKSHGSADVFAFEQAILKAVEEVRGGLLRRIAEQVGAHHNGPAEEEGEAA